MNKISTLSTLAHLCLWQSQRQDFPNSSRGQRKAELKEAHTCLSHHVLVAAAWPVVRWFVL